MGKDELELMVTQATLLSKGLIQQTKAGTQITDKGYERAYHIWEELSGEDRILLGGFIKIQLGEAKRTK